MFNASHIDDLRLVNGNVTGENQYHLSTSIYAFKAKEGRYLLRIEKYVDSLYILKFYDKNHEGSDHKYNLLNNRGEAGRVIRTVIDKAVEIYTNEDTNASFGFIGAHKVIKGKDVEAKSETARYRIYNYVVNNFFPSARESWQHFRSNKTSAYIIVNPCYFDPEKQAKKWSSVFAEIYDDFSGIEVSRCA